MKTIPLQTEDLVLLDQLAKHDDPEVRQKAIKVRDTILRRKRILALVQEALSQIKLDMKYIMFDLECTRREKKELEERLGEQ